MLKDRSKVFKSATEEEWYECAFGKKRNIMKYRMKLDIPEGVKFQQYEFVAEVTYQIYPEHVTEFANLGFRAGEQRTFEVKLVNDPDYDAPTHFEKEIELPFGLVSSELRYRELNGEDKKLQKITV